MNKLIICDWNRTLFDPETKLLYPQSLPFLSAMKDNKLVLISRMENESKDYIKEFSLENFFIEIIIGEAKNKSTFLRIKQKYIDLDYWVVGDKVDSEILLGNTCGYKTIRVRQGKYKDQSVVNEAEFPDYQVNTLSEAALILLSQ
jgi:FMN phosphatase YigB (HAD superfamily)